MTNFVTTISITLGYILRFIIIIYQYAISPLIPATCRYWPSCSNFASQAIHMHGPLYGGLLSLKRLMRCHPWGGHGFDPVPTNKNHHTGVIK